MRTRAGVFRKEPASTRISVSLSCKSSFVFYSYSRQRYTFVKCQLQKHCSIIISLSSALWKLQNPNDTPLWTIPIYKYTYTERTIRVKASRIQQRATSRDRQSCTFYIYRKKYKKIGAHPPAGHRDVYLIISRASAARRTCVYIYSYAGQKALSPSLSAARAH